jgi:hypothetical protein
MHRVIRKGIATVFKMRGLFATLMILFRGLTKKKPCIRLWRLSGLFVFILRLSKLSSGNEDYALRQPADRVILKWRHLQRKSLSFASLISVFIISIPYKSELLTV